MKKEIIISAIAALLLISCSNQKKIAQHFVDRSYNVKVALFVPDMLIKNNLRDDTIPSEMDTLSDEAKIAYLEKQIKVIDKVDDTKFIDILYFSMEKELRAYGLDIEYWPVDSIPADSLHWVIDIPKVEVTEFVDYQRVAAKFFDNIVYVTVPVDMVNVATWFDLNDDKTDETAFVEQNYSNDYDGFFDVDDNERVIAKIYADSIDLDGFYRFANMLGKLYAGYCFDYLMNNYIDSNIDAKTIDTVNRFRYNPYERVFYKTDCDKLIPLK